MGCSGIIRGELRAAFCSVSKPVCPTIDELVKIAGTHSRRVRVRKSFERDLVLETLAKTDGNRTASARLLGFSITTLRNKIAEYSADGVCHHPAA